MNPWSTWKHSCQLLVNVEALLSTTGPLRRTRALEAAAQGCGHAAPSRLSLCGARARVPRPSSAALARSGRSRYHPGRVVAPAPLVRAPGSPLWKRSPVPLAAPREAWGGRRPRHAGADSVRRGVEGRGTLWKRYFVWMEAGTRWLTECLREAPQSRPEALRRQRALVTRCLGARDALSCRSDAARWEGAARIHWMGRGGDTPAGGGAGARQAVTCKGEGGMQAAVTCTGLSGAGKRCSTCGGDGRGYSTGRERDEERDRDERGNDIAQALEAVT